MYSIVQRGNFDSSSISYYHQNGKALYVTKFWRLTLIVDTHVLYVRSNNTHIYLYVASV